MTNPKALSRLYFRSGVTLSVIESHEQIVPPNTGGPPPPLSPLWTCLVHETNGTAHYVALQNVEQVEVLA